MIPLLLFFIWTKDGGRESVKYFRSYASLKYYVGEIKEREK